MVSADVKDALNGLRQTETQITKTAAETGKQTGKVEGFLGKWKMGWIAVSVAAVASLYAIAKSSSVIRGYFEEFGMIVGNVFDEIGIAMAPIIDPLLNFLWGLSDSFEALPGPVKAGFGAIILGAAGLLTVIPILAALKASLATLGVASSMSLLATAGSLAAYTGIVAIAVGAAHGYYVTWKDAWDKMGKEPGTAWAIIKTSMMNITGGIPLYLAASIADLTGYGRQFQDNLDRMLIFWIQLWAIKIPTALRNGLNAIRTHFSAWYSAGAELVNSFIRGIGDIGMRVWNYIQSQLSIVDNNLWQWASGLLGFSPTLKEIGSMIPRTIVEAASIAQVSAPPYTPSISTMAGGKTTIEKNEYHITVPITIKGGLSSDRELHELARKLKSHLMRELNDLGRG